MNNNFFGKGTEFLSPKKCKLRLINQLTFVIDKTPRAVISWGFFMQTQLVTTFASGLTVTEVRQTCDLIYYSARKVVCQELHQKFHQI